MRKTMEQKMINKLLIVRLNNVHKDEQKTLKTYLEENCWDWTVIDKETIMGSFDTTINSSKREK
jgi:hypothetical protein